MIHSLAWHLPFFYEKTPHSELLMDREVSLLCFLVFKPFYITTQAEYPVQSTYPTKSKIFCQMFKLEYIIDL